MAAKKLRKRSLSAFLAMVIVCSLFAFSITADAVADNVMTIRSVYLRVSASGSSSVLETIASGVSLTLIADSSDGWAYVNHNGTKGYCLTTYLNAPSGSGVKMYGTPTDDVNLRNGKGTNYQALTVVPEGTVITVTDNSDETWVKVSYGSYSGYIRKDYIVIGLSASVVASTSTSKPYAAPSVKTHIDPSKETLSISATSATVYKGCDYQIIASSNSAVTWTSSSTSVATVSGDGIVTAKAAGTTVITAKTATLKATCTIKVISGNTVTLSTSSAKVCAGKTYLSYSYTSGVSWSSSNTAVATVKNGYILGKKAGKAVITASTSSGAATILVTVTAAAPIRFAYTSPNCAVKNGNVTLVAITDQTREAVRFIVTVGSTTKTVDATSRSADGSNYLWKGTTTFSDAGTYKVVAYSKVGGTWSTCGDGQTTAFVTNTTNRTTTICANRRASDEVINLIANYEGFISSIYADPITGDPTVGYGRVIYSGQQFYNALTKNEAYAYLVQTVNNDGYADKVNSFLVSNKVKFNQQQFDALVSFVYNNGTGPLANDSELMNALLNCSDGTGKTTYYINTSDVNFRKGASLQAEIIRKLSYNTTVTILNTKNPEWTYVQTSDGTKGYVFSEYISKKTVGGTLDLIYVGKQNLINKFCQYHHAAGSCIWGLLYRRVDEMEVFFYNNYERNQGVFKYNISFKCANNPSFHT